MLGLVPSICQRRYKLDESGRWAANGQPSLLHFGQRA